MESNTQKIALRIFLIFVVLMAIYLVHKLLNPDKTDKTDETDETDETDPPNYDDWKPPDPLISSDFSVNACIPPETEGKVSPPGIALGHMCPHLMLGHPVMLQAAKDDKLDSDYAYAVVGFDGGQCGECFEIQFDPNDPWKRKSLIAQVFNSQAGGETNLDIYMPAGGFGAFNSCFEYSKNVDDNQSKSGDFAYIKYPGSKEDENTTGDNFVSTNDMWYEGGIRGGDKKVEKYKNIYKINDRSQCDGLFKKPGTSDKVEKDITSACKWVFDNNYHYNSGDAMGIEGTQTKVKKIKCPLNLMKITGLHRNPTVDKDLPEAGEEKGEWLENLTTTTMEDCCMPTCSRSNNVKDADSEYNAMYTCDKYGDIITKDPEKDNIFCCNYSKSPNLYNACETCDQKTSPTDFWCLTTKNYLSVYKDDPESENARLPASDQNKARCIGF